MKHMIIHEESLIVTISKQYQNFNVILLVKVLLGLFHNLFVDHECGRTTTVDLANEEDREHEQARRNADLS